MKLVIDAPNEKQRRAMLSKKKYIGYGGARGGGKSWFCRVKATLMCLKYPNLKVLILRRTYPELRGNHIEPLVQMLHCKDPDKSKRIATYNDSQKEFRFPNGSLIKLGYCKNENDKLQFQGQEYDAIFFDECTHFAWSTVQFILTSLRNTREDFNTRAYFMGNPGGVGHVWFKRLFIDRAYLEGEDPEEYEYIPATVDDNKLLMQNDPDYIKLLDSLPEKMRQAHRFGNWNVFEGQFFEEFTQIAPTEEDQKMRRWTHVIEPFEIPANWPIYRSYDFGYAKPFSMAWWTVDYDGRIYRILEYYGCVKNSPNEGLKITANEQFKKAHEIETTHRWLKGKKIYGPADPAIWDESRGESIAETAEKYGIYFDKGDHNRLAGWMQMHYRLSFDQEGIPMMYIFNTCEAFIRTVPTLQYSETHPEDLDTTGEDHVADEARYFCMSRPLKPRVNHKKGVIRDDPLDLYSEKKYGRYEVYM